MEMSESSDPGFLADGESKLTRMVCPECGGSLAQLELPQITYFRCHTGHQYAPQTLAASQAEVSESKLWAAVAALEEQAVLLHFLDGAATGGANGAIADAAGADRFAEQVARRAAILREQARKWTMPVAGQPEETAD
jgi:two-component system chemotaxis response regulator CheB